MSIAFVRAKPISRGTGQSAVACAAYRACTTLVDAREEKRHDYSRKSGLLGEGMRFPDGAQMERGELWNLVEKTENRKDARLAKEFILALPHELPLEDQKAICEKAADILRGGTRIADWTIHKPSREGDERNVHGHILVTDRTWENGEFAKKKDREWNKDDWLQGKKIQIAEICNERLRSYGLPEVDARSYDEKIESGLEDPERQTHNGVVLTNLVRRENAKLKRLEKQMAQLEALGYGDTKRSTGISRSTDERGREPQKPDRQNEGRDRGRDSDLGW